MSTTAPPITYDPVRYLWLRDEHKTPIGCLAYTVPDPNATGLRWGLSILHHGTSWSGKSPVWLDSAIRPGTHDRFNRRLGREIAKGRLLSPSAPAAANLIEALRRIGQSDAYPARIREAATRHADYLRSKPYGKKGPRLGPQDYLAMVQGEQAMPVDMTPAEVDALRKFADAFRAACSHPGRGRALRSIDLVFGTGGDGDGQ